jgi:acetyl esterase/lipase
VSTGGISRRAAFGVAAALAAAAAGCSSRPSLAQADPVTRYSYGDHPSQYAELSLPEAFAAAPVVIVVHGGYWTRDYGLELGRPLAAELAANGFAALNVEYRRVGEGGGWPQTGDDVLAAAGTLRERKGVDLSNVVGLGHSSGGQLAAWLATQGALSGVVLQAAVLDLAAGSTSGLGGGAVDAYLGGSPQRRPDAYAQASPMAKLPLGVRSILVHGTRDTLVPIDQSQRFVDAARAAGDQSELRTFDGDHFDPITVGTDAWRMCLDAVKELTGR